MKQLIYTIFLVLMTLNAIGQNTETIDLTQIIKCRDEVTVSLVADHITYVKLQTDQNCLIGRIGQIAIIDDKIIVLDSSAKKIYVFNNKGEFQNSIARKGNGPGEYTSLRSGFIIDQKNKQILFSTGSRHSIAKYNLDGTFTGEIPINHYFTNLVFVGDKIAVYTSSAYTPASNFQLIQMVERDGTVIGDFHKIQIRDNSLDMMSTVYNIGSNMRYWEPPWDKIYEFDGKRIIEKYNIDFGGEKMPKEYFYSLDLMNEHLNDYLGLRELQEFENMIIVRISAPKNQINSRYYYFPKSGKTYVCTYKRNLESWSMIDDLNGGPPVSLINKASSMIIWNSIEPIDLINKKQEIMTSGKSAISKEGHKMLLEIIDSSKINDNPIVQLIHLK